MAEQSLLAKLGMRLGVLGSAASLAIAAPLSNGNPSMDAHTDASRIGVYFDRTVSSERVGLVVMGTDVMQVRQDVVACAAPITAVTGAGQTLFESTADAGGNTYLLYDHTDGTVTLQSEIISAFPLMQVNDNTVTATGSEEAFKVTTYASKPGLFQVTNDTLTTGYAVRAAAGIGNANAIQAYIGNGVGTAAVIDIEDDRVTLGYSIDASDAGQARFIGTEYVPQAVNPGGANTLWVDSGSGDLMFGASPVGGGGGTIGGSIAINQVAFGSGANTIQGVASFTFTAANGLVVNLASSGADNLTIGSTAGNSLTSGNNNTLLGTNAGTTLTTQANNTAVGYNALSLSTASGNTAVGSGAGDALVGGLQNVCVGFNALGSAVSASDCVAVGYNALALATGGSNTMVGSGAGDSITSGQRNTGVGTGVLEDLVTSSDNTAVGYFALSNCTSTNNTALGNNAGFGIVGGARNVAVGVTTLVATTSANDCTAVGYNVLTNSTGGQNTAMGSGAADALTVSQNIVAVGYNALGAATGNAGDSVAVGAAALLNSDGLANTAVGAGAAQGATTATGLVAVGYLALSGVTGDNCTAVGSNCLAANTGAENTAIGANAADAVTTATRIVAIGRNALGAGTTGVSDCTAVGYNAGLVLTGARTTLIGSQAGDSMTGADDSVAIGYNAASTLTTGDQNVAIGSQAMETMTTTTAGNIAIGFRAMQGTSAGGAIGNVAIGSAALQVVTSGSANIAIGGAALGAITTQANNVAIGNNALTLCTAAENVGVGYQAADALTTSTRVVAIGFNALGAGSTGVSDSTAVGHQSLLLATGLRNTALGASAGAVTTTGTDNIFLGVSAGDSTANNASNRCVIGSATSFITDVYIGKGETVAGMATTSLVIHATGGSGANVDAADLTLAGGIGTGQGPGGRVVLSAAPPAAGSSSTPNTLMEGLILSTPNVGNVVVTIPNNGAALVPTTPSVGALVIACAATGRYVGIGDGVVNAEVNVIAGSGFITGNANALMTSNVAWNDGAGAGAGTLTNAPTAGDPTKWIPVDDNGTTRYIPSWT